MKQQQLSLLVIAGCLLSFAMLMNAQDPQEDAKNQAAKDLFGDKIQGGLQSLEDSIGFTREEELKDLSDEHRMIKEECLNLKTLIDQAKADGTPVDPKLQEDYEQCQEDLEECEEDMEQVTKEINEDTKEDIPEPPKPGQEPPKPDQEQKPWFA